MTCGLIGGVIGLLTRERPIFGMIVGLIVGLITSVGVGLGCWSESPFKNGVISGSIAGLTLITGILGLIPAIVSMPSVPWFSTDILVPGVGVKTTSC
jgi:hypothetical protein